MFYICAVKQSNTYTMTTEQFKATATAKMETLSTNDLIVEVKKLANDFSNAASIVMDVALDILMERLPESEFVNFCDSL
jgi:hypothetical protein